MELVHTLHISSLMEPPFESFHYIYFKNLNLMLFAAEIKDISLSTYIVLESSNYLITLILGFMMDRMSLV